MDKLKEVCIAIGERDWDCDLSKIMRQIQDWGRTIISIGGHFRLETAEGKLLLHNYWYDLTPSIIFGFCLQWSRSWTLTENQKINNLKLDAEKWQEKSDEYADRVKELEQESLEKDHQIQALTRKNQVLEEQVEKLEGDLTEIKRTAEESHSLKTSNENYSKKNLVLEEELEEADKNLKETTEKLRETDIKAEQLERKVTTLESEKEEWERKYEELTEKYQAAKAELEEISQQLEAIWDTPDSRRFDGFRR